MYFNKKNVLLSVMTKLLVGSGMPIDRAGDHFEIIDLSQPQIPGINLNIVYYNCIVLKFGHFTE
jgi:hypothetical protein